MRAAALALWMAACVGAQPFPMRYLGELGHLPAGGRVGPAVAVAEGVVRLEGPGWRYTRGVTGGAGWTTLYTADFDADGQADFLLADHFPGVGRCVNAASLTVVLFDRAGRPVLRELATQLPRTVGDAFPFTPVVVRRRQGRAEFVTVGCDGGQTGTWRAAVPAAPGTGKPPTGGWLDELPRTVIVDRRDRRDIDSANPWPLLVEAWRHGWPSTRIAGSLYVDGRGLAHAGEVTIEFHVSSSTPEPGPAPAPTGEIQEDGVTVRTSHTAMGHTVTGETRYTPPPGARRLTGIGSVGDFDVTQWDAGRLALHSGDGECLFPEVTAPARGRLISGGDGLVFLDGDRAIRLRGRLRWRRIPAAP